MVVGVRTVLPVLLVQIARMVVVVFVIVVRDNYVVTTNVCQRVTQTHQLVQTVKVDVVHKDMLVVVGMDVVRQSNVAMPNVVRLEVLVVEMVVVRGNVAEKLVVVETHQTVVVIVVVQLNVVVVLVAQMVYPVAETMVVKDIVQTLLSVQIMSRVMMVALVI